jgi:hypothetical protein
VHTRVSRQYPQQYKYLEAKSSKVKPERDFLPRNEILIKLSLLQETATRAIPRDLHLPQHSPEAIY